VSGATRFRHLFSPLRLGPVTLDNRIVFSAHLTNYARDGLPTVQHAAYYGARARGGAGLIITEEHSTHPTDWPYEKLIHGFEPKVLDGYRRITDAVHAYDVPVFAQINHNGGQASSMYSRLPVWAPSPVPDPLFREVPKAVDENEIAEITDGYATVAARCIEGGFDGIELQCSHSSIVRGFLSPVTNTREDRYGGNLANRARLLLELVGAVRDAIGPDRALGVRLCGDELIEGGTDISDAVEVAGMVDATGLVDYVNTSIGVATASLFMIEASMQVPPGYASYVSSAIRDAVSVPVVGVGRFKDPLQADRALQEGICDLVGVVRGQIADADFAAKARSGHPTDIRTCLSCNQECVGRMGLNRWLGCIENPRTGREAGHLPPPRRRRKVVVVGGGPGGLQAAVTAAERGHSVTLFERRDRLGGQVQVAATVPGRAEFFDLARNLIVAARREGVELRTGREASVAEVLAEQPDAVIVATGARPARPLWAGEHPRVVDVRDVLEGRADPEGDVVIVDELGFHQATSTAELLADRGCRVEIVTSAMVVGQDLGITLDMEIWHVKAHAKGIVQSVDLVPMGVTGAEDRPGGVVLALQHHPTGTDEQRVCDWVVCSVHQEPEDDLWRALRTDRFVSVERIGDCVAPRRAHAAVVEGHRAAVAL
jgi:2,4-dienoyl-CoA reductase (NADPH2)